MAFRRPPLQPPSGLVWHVWARKPEGFASILWKDGKRAKEAAEVMKITAHDLKELDVVDDIIPEFGGADEDALSSIGNYMKGNMKKFLEKESKLTKDQLLEERYKRFRKF